MGHGRESDVHVCAHESEKTREDTKLLFNYQLMASSLVWGEAISICS